MTDDSIKKDGWPSDVPLPFFQWRQSLCPHGANLASCMSCEHCRGVTFDNWPGEICGIYNAAAWRAYCATFWKACAFMKLIQTEAIL